VSIVIGLLALVLIPNLLDVRDRANEAAIQTCLKEISTLQEANIVFYMGYSSIGANDYPSACREVTVAEVSVSTTYYEYIASHPQASRVFAVEPGTGVYEP